MSERRFERVKETKRAVAPVIGASHGKNKKRPPKQWIVEVRYATRPWFRVRRYRTERIATAAARQFELRWAILSPETRVRVVTR